MASVNPTFFTILMLSLIFHYFLILPLSLLYSKFICLFLSQRFIPTFVFLSMINSWLYCCIVGQSSFSHYMHFFGHLPQVSISSCSAGFRCLLRSVLYCFYYCSLDYLTTLYTNAIQCLRPTHAH